MTLPEIRHLPAIEPRLETGPVAFGDDWPGCFIRGDNCAHYAMHLRGVLENIELGVIVTSVLRGLLSALESCNLVLRDTGHTSSSSEP